MRTALMALLGVASLASPAQTQQDPQDPGAFEVAEVVRDQQRRFGIPEVDVPRGGQRVEVADDGRFAKALEAAMQRLR